MLKRGLVQTYGRHRQRVINVEVWTPDDVNVFSNSDNSSLLDFKSPAMNAVAARQRRKRNGKENMREEGRPRRRVKEKNEGGLPADKTGKRKSLQRHRSPLCDASNVSVSDSPAKKRPTRRKKVVVDTSCQELSSRFNFSELDKYSLIMSDSVEVVASDGDAGWKNTNTVTTSTPHVASFGMGRIDGDSAVVPPGVSYLDSTSPLSMCRVELERLHVSDVSNITGTSRVGSVSSYHGDSPSVDVRTRLQQSTEGVDASISYDASCDMFDDAPPSRRESRRSMYLLRSRQKCTTRGNCMNDSLGGSMYNLRCLSPVKNTSEELIVSSDDEEEVPSSVESVDSEEDSLSDIFEEEESTTSEGMCQQLSMSSRVSVSSRTSLLSSFGTSRHSIKSALTPRKSSCPPLTAKDRVLAQCCQEDVCRFTDCITPPMMKTVTKIGEGVYGEVFRAQRGRQSVALKVIPIEGNFPVNDEPQKTFEEMLPEIVISKELSALRDNDVNRTENFVHVLGVHVVEGSYPLTFLKQWDLFHKRKRSENDRPDMYKDSQLFLVFEFADSGADMESFEFDNLDEAHSVLAQVISALAIAEAELQFEHRDLHWGNVLVRRTEKATIDCCLKGTRLEVESSGVEVSIIDFTLSRLSQDGCHVFTDLSKDPTLFTGQGEYQFDIYRLMKDENSNDWMPHHPFTNVLWIHYLADKLVHGKRYTAASENRSQHQVALRQFRTFLRGTLNYGSAEELLQEDLFI